MSDLIDRQTAIDAVRFMQTHKLSEGDDMLLVDKAEVMTELMMLTSPQPERKTGKWVTIDLDSSPKTKILNCSVCHCATGIYMPSYRFCPWCGAKMTGDNADG